MNRCPHCLMMKSNNSSKCACQCKHEYERQITKVLYQTTNNVYSGLVCKHCGDIKSEYIENYTQPTSKYNDYVFQRF